MGSAKNKGSLRGRAAKSQKPLTGADQILDDFAAPDRTESQWRSYLDTVQNAVKNLEDEKARIKKEQEDEIRSSIDHLQKEQDRAREKLQKEKKKLEAQLLALDPQTKEQKERMTNEILAKFLPRSTDIEQKLSARKLAKKDAEKQKAGEVDRKSAVENNLVLYFEEALKKTSAALQAFQKEAKNPRGFKVPQQKGEWAVLPGQPGFNSYALKVMTSSSTVPKDKQKVLCKPRDEGYLQPYQRTASFLFSPKTPVQRLLVMHRTGSGKTLSMIRCLDNFFKDVRPKLIVFPAYQVAIQFYSELMAWENQYRTFVLEFLGWSKNQEMVDKCSKKRLSSAEVEAVRELLEFRSQAQGSPALDDFRRNLRDAQAGQEHPFSAGRASWPASPLRVVDNYQSLGGRTLENAAYLKAWTEKGGNILSNKVIIVDEAHNLVFQDREALANKVSQQNLGLARQKLKEGRGTALAFFTATPIQEKTEELQQMLEILKAPVPWGSSALNDEGFVSSFLKGPGTAYPTVLPSGDRALPTLLKTEITEGLLKHMQESLAKSKQADRDEVRGIFETWPACSRGYIQKPAFKKQFSRTELRKKREGKSEADPVAWLAPKFAKVATEVLEAQKKGVKTLVLGRRKSGIVELARYLTEFHQTRAFAALGKPCAAEGYRQDVAALVQDLWGEAGEEASPSFWARKAQPSSSRYQQELDSEMIKLFNSEKNLNGKVLPVLLLNSSVYSTGVDLKDVGLVLLLDVPKTWSDYLQQIGRSIRHCSHQNLRAQGKETPEVHLKMLCSTLPASEANGETVDEARFVRLKDSSVVIEEEIKRVEKNSVDYMVLMATGGDKDLLVDEEDLATAKAQMEEELQKCQKEQTLCEASVRRVLVYASSKKKAEKEMGLTSGALASLQRLFDLKPSEIGKYARKFDSREVEQLREIGLQLQGTFDEFTALLGKKKTKDFFGDKKFKDKFSQKFEQLLTKQRQNCMLDFHHCRKKVEQHFYNKFPAEKLWSLAWLKKKFF